jgi:hypothetical protein
MKSQAMLRILKGIGFFLLLSILRPQLSSCLAQGSLTPPGAPAPTMKTLDQIEARTPISSAPFIISQPGSYYLTTNLITSGGYGVWVATNNVTLDLNGLTISSSSPGNSGIGIWINGGNRDIAIFNGHIKSGVTNNGSGVYSGPGFVNGILGSGPAPQNVRVSGITVSGILSAGISLGSGDSTVVEHCAVHTVGGYGIAASSVADSTALDCGNDALSATATANNCYASSGGNAIICNGTAENCRGDSVNGTGVNASVAINCYGSSAVSGDGVSGSDVSNCHGEGAGSGNGVTAYIANNCGGSASASGNGVSATSAINCVGSSSSGNGIYAIDVALGCYGYSTTGTGLYTFNAAFCTAASTSFRAIQATIANGCLSTGGTNLITFKYNMP